MADEQTTEQPEVQPETKPAKTTKPSASVGLEQFASLYAENVELKKWRDQVEAERQAQLKAQEEKYLAEIAERDGAQKALAAQKDLEAKKYAELSERYSRLEQETIDRAVEAVIARGFSGAKFISDAAKKQAETLIRSEIKAERNPETGKISILHQGTGLYADEYIGSHLDTDYAHFLAPATRGSAVKPGGDGKSGATVEPPDPNRAIRDNYLKRLAESAQGGTILLGRSNVPRPQA